MIRETDLKMLFKKAESRVAQTDYSPPSIAIPNSYIMKLTTNCNLRCKYCYMGECSHYEQMDESLFLQILDQIKMLNSKFTIYLHGGEPCLRVDLIESLRAWLNENKLSDNVKIMLQTNGTILNERIIGLIKEMKINIGISIDGIHPETNCLRVSSNNTSTVNLVLNNIDKLHAENIEMGIFSVLTSYNAPYMLETLQYFAEKGIHSFVINPLVLWGNAEKSKTIMATQEQVYNSYKDLVDWMSSYNAIHNDNQVTERNLHWWTKGMKEGCKGYMCNCSPCGAGIQTVAISPLGDVYICDQYYGDDRFLIGNLRKSNLYSIIKGAQSAINSLRNIFNINTCRKCEWRHVCSGGCSAASFYYSGNMNSVAPYCDAYKSIFNYLDMKLQDSRVVL